MRIKILIKEKGFTQKTFAAKLGMSTVGLSQILSGKPSYTTLEKIASALDVEMWELFVSAEEAAAHTDTPHFTCPKCGCRLNILITEKDKGQE